METDFIENFDPKDVEFFGKENFSSEGELLIEQFLALTRHNASRIGVGDLQFLHAMLALASDMMSESFSYAATDILSEMIDGIRSKY